jgi:hypothetical protein
MQGFLDAPQKIGFADRAKDMQPFADALRQAAQHRQFGRIRGHNPDQWPRMACRLK